MAITEDRSEQDAHCVVCGASIRVRAGKVTYPSFDRPVCGAGCWDEWAWRKVLSVLGKRYRQRQGVGNGSRSLDKPEPVK